MEKLIAFGLCFALIGFLVVFAFFNACLSWFLDFCMEEGNIFGRYRLWLARHFIKPNGNDFWYKPLGGCIVCFNIWLSIPVYLFCIYFFELVALGEWHVPLWIIYATVSNFFVRKMIGD